MSLRYRFIPMIGVYLLPTAMNTTAMNVAHFIFFRNVLTGAAAARLAILRHAEVVPVSLDIDRRSFHSSRY